MKKVNNVCRCRLCACEEDFHNFFNIFDENPELELEMKITKLLPVVVMPWDPMSHMVCQRCIEKLNSFNEFYDASLKAERFLRTLHPSAPESKIENCDPVVHVLDESSILNEKSLKLPPKKRQGLSECSRKIKKNISNSPESGDSPQNLQNLDNHEDEVFTRRTLNCFIVTQITEKDSFFTCRDCCRTFTKQSSALAHSCVRIEDCGEAEAINLDEGSHKSLPPLKIRLFSVKSGLFVCYLCQAPYEDKKELVEHLKEHFSNENEEVKTPRRNSRPKGRRKIRSRDECEEDKDWEETYTKRGTKRKRRNCSGQQRRGRPKSRGELEDCWNGTCTKCGQEQNSSAVKETVERTTQYSENKEDETLPILKSSFEEEDDIVMTKNEIEYVPDVPDEKFLEGGKEEDVTGRNDITDDVEEISKVVENDDRSDEVTVLEVVNNKTSTFFSSCIFCDKIFATKDALIVHQNKHLQGYSKAMFDNHEKRVALHSKENDFLCSVCPVMFSNSKTLLEHEQTHFAEVNGAGFQKKIHIALDPEFPDREVEQDCQISKGREIITITVTAGEKKIPQPGIF